MMASRNILHIPRTYVFESDESEEEMSFNGMDYQAMSIDLIQQLSTQYRNINNAELHNIFKTRVNKKFTKSKAVQTGPDASGIPPSWILTGEELVDELYTGISNVINALYHHPFETQKQDAVKVHCASNGDVKYEPVLPEGRCGLPRLSLYSRLDYQKLIVNSEEFKKKLHNMKETAMKLRGLIPYLDTSVNIEPERSGRKTSKIMKNKCQQTDFEKLQKCDHQGIKSCKEACTSASKFLDSLSNFSSAASIDSKASSHVGERTLKSHSAEAYHLQKTDSQKGTLKSAGGCKISNSCESIHIPPITVCRHKLQQSENQSTKMNGVHVGKDSNNRIQEKDEKAGKENPFQSKTVASSSSSSKNFIKRNILALKVQSVAGSSSKSSSTASHDTQRNIFSQKKREKKT